MSFNQENNREFERYTISLNVEVKFLDEQSIDQQEATLLRDISGGGARFVTTHPDHYHIGQKVDLMIELPGGTALHAKMEGLGRVAWIGELEEGEISIGLCMDDLLAFENIVDVSERDD